MDWGRAKSVLIISFLMLNVLLGYQLWSDIREQLNANVNSAELPQDKVLLMQQKRITLSANLPSDTPKLGDLTYLLHSDVHQKSGPTQLETPIDSSLMFINKEELIKALGSEVPELEHYAYDLHNSREGVFVLHRMVDGRPMFNAKLELYNSNLKITGFLQDRVELIGRGEAKQVLPAAKIVASLIETYLKEGSVITDIQLGYHGQIFDSEKQVSAPSWRVMLEDGKVYYVHAISGEVATDGTDDAEAGGGKAGG
ncbi:two-component system regulatory protein YycI [Paenibacillus sp. LHD-117]|uniref:two-component system regulatory protein YycI n=1 Tax=Paenibacillus sp. LHD-117 TaxID=3071412 RepID=UPI0027E08701|nr:two-component system regulatory protein YycI [Paenibacillus sp. LHD-117]MDQ6421924.1 two-component system regulatory protein YycI [Paenibacillus sp. LHD-117]